MPTKLKNLKVTRVALVDEGANPDAHIRFAKNKDGAPHEPAQTDETGLVKRILSVISKAFGLDGIEKDAHTFAEGEEIRNYDRVFYDETYPMNWAFMDSIGSILRDTDIDETQKATLMQQSLDEFAAAFSAAIPAWAKADSADKKLAEKSVDILTKARDDLNNALKAKEDDEEEDADENPDDDNDGDEKKPAVKKGATPDMKFNTDQMSPEEKAVYEDLAKRFGSEETPAVPAPPVQEPAAPTAGDDDVYKGLHPAVKAEMESLRKFREDAENREFTEIAKKYGVLGKKPEELAPVLKSLKAAGGTAYADMISVLDGSVDAINKSGVFDEIGKRGSADSTEGAWAKIEAAATEIQKAAPTKSWADSIDEACMKHPELVSEYEKSRR